ncbi:MAG: SDR family NAD(P)-dependent oxidoreductase [Pseudomonadota bacterium]
MYSLQGKVAVVTGAGSGIGRALAQLLSAKGCKLAISDINEKGLAETAASLKGEVMTAQLDVSNRAAVYAHAEAVKAKYGTVHVVINNAGVAVSQTVEKISYEDFEWLMGINFWGVVYGTKAFLPMMTAQNEGVMVNISSVFGIIAVPTQGAYNAAKFAVRGFTEALRHEVHGTGVKTVCVHPGGIKTNIVNSSRHYVDPDGSTDKKAIADRFQRIAATTPEKAAATIVRGIERSCDRVLIGADAWLIDRIQRWFPISYGAFLRVALKLGPK